MLNSGSLSDHAREASERIENLGKEIVTSFKSNEAEMRVHNLQRFGSDILVRMLPVMNWIERRRSAENTPNWSSSDFIAFFMRR